MSVNEQLNVGEMKSITVIVLSVKYEIDQIGTGVQKNYCYLY